MNFKGISISRIQSTAYGTIAAVTPFAMYMDEVGGWDNVSIWKLIIFVGSVTGGGVAGYHVPSGLLPRSDSLPGLSLAEAIKRVEAEPAEVVHKVSTKMIRKTTPTGEHR